MNCSGVSSNSDGVALLLSADTLTSLLTIGTPRRTHTLNNGYQCQIYDFK